MRRDIPFQDEGCACSAAPPHSGSCRIRINTVLRLLLAPDQKRHGLLLIRRQDRYFKVYLVFIYKITQILGWGWEVERVFCTRLASRDMSQSR